jgi:hypothetical protein
MTPTTGKPLDWPLEREWPKETWSNFVTRSAAQLGQIYRALELELDRKSTFKDSKMNLLKDRIENSTGLASQAPKTEEQLIRAAANVRSGFRIEIENLAKEYFPNQDLEQCVYPTFLTQTISLYTILSY